MKLKKKLESGVKCLRSRHSAGETGGIFRRWASKSENLVMANTKPLMGIDGTFRNGTLKRRNKSLPNLRRLDDTTSSTSSNSHIVTAGAVMRLEELDDSLHRIGGQEYFSGCSECVFSANGTREKHESKCGIKRLHRNDLYRTSCLGKGSFADVHVVADSHGDCFAMKALNASRIKSSEIFVTAAIDLAMEAKILSELNHKNIIELRGISCTTFSNSFSEDIDEGFFIVLDILRHTLSESLVKWRKESSRASALENRWSIMPKLNVQDMYGRMKNVTNGILNAMIYLQEQHIVLRDLKPSNVGFDMMGNVRLFDFGMARKLEDCDDSEVCGSPRYMAPEVMLCRGYSFKTDVYSFGILLYELCSLTIAYDSIKKYSKLEDFFRFIAEHKWRPKLGRIACPLTKELIEECWQSDPNERPSFSEINSRISKITS